MKGTPEMPQCGFSRASIQILGLQGVNPEKFTAFNVLEDPELRQGKIFCDKGKECASRRRIFAARRMVLGLEVTALNQA